MILKRIGLATAVAAAFSMSGCAMWQGLTSRLGGGERTATASSTGGTGSGMRRDATPGGGMTMSGGPLNAPMPRFSSYNECRQWFGSATAGRMTNQGSWQGGEITPSDHDPCRRLGGWS